MHGSAREYDVSTRGVFNAIGVGLREIEDWSCCGAMEATERDTINLSQRNLELAHGEVVVPCSICYYNELRASKDHPVGVRHPLDLLSGELFERVKDNIEYGVPLRAAAFYGCLTVRPGDLSFEDPENPSSLERLLGAVGAEAVDFDQRLECCGGALMPARLDLPRGRAREILGAAGDADMLVVACPMCHAVLDMLQSTTPVLYFTQVLGLALGLDERSVGAHRHHVSTKSVVDAVEAIK